MKLQLIATYIFHIFKFVSFAHGLGLLDDDEIERNSKNGTSLCEDAERCLDKGLCKDKGYKEKYPSGNNFTEVYTEFVHFKIKDIIRKENKIRISIKQRLSWLDNRIKLDPSYKNLYKPLGIRKYLPYDDWKKAKCYIWYPKIFRKGLDLQTEDITDPFECMIFVIPLSGKNQNPNIIMEQDYHLNVDCDLSVDKFPFDAHDCAIKESNIGKQGLELVFGKNPTGILPAPIVFKNGTKIFY